MNANQLAVMSDLIERSNLARSLGQQFNGKRDIYESLGYKKHLTYDDYYACYDRQDIAGRIVDMPASSTWRHTPEIKEDNKEEDDTPFELDWSTLSSRIRMWHYLERVDRLAGIGRYAILLIGIRGDTILSEPLERGSLNSPEDIIYLSPFSEKAAEIRTWVTNPGDPRFGRPETYEVNFAGDLEGEKGVTPGKMIVHHSRVLHVTEGLLEDEAFGRPRLRRVMNCLNDLAKVVGGSAEMFWQGAFRGLHANVKDDGTGIPPDGEEAEKISEELDEYIHGLRRYIRTQGIELNTLPSDTPDPRGIFDVTMSLVAGASGIPKRILLGAERGELASSQDETNFNAYISERQQHFGEPLVLRPLIDRLVDVGALSEPTEEYLVEWPNLFELSEADRAEIADKQAATIQKYVASPMAEEVVPIPEFRREILGLEDYPSKEDEAYLGDRLEDEFEGPDDVDEEFVERVRGE